METVDVFHFLLYPVMFAAGVMNNDMTCIMGTYLKTLVRVRNPGQGLDNLFHWFDLRAAHRGIRFNNPVVFASVHLSSQPRVQMPNRYNNKGYMPDVPDKGRDGNNLTSKCCYNTSNKADPQEEKSTTSN